MRSRSLASAWLAAPLIGVLAGLSSWVFIHGLDRVSTTRVEHRWLVWLLPGVGFGLGLVNRYVAGRAVEGTALVVREANEPRNGVPKRMWCIALAGTLIGHLFGGSVGREGTAVQMSGSLAETALGRLVHGRDAKQVVLTAAIAAGFGAVFAVPWAGTVFALEIVKGWRIRLASALPALGAALIGDRIVKWLGADHGTRRQIPVHASAGLYGRVVVLGLAGGLTGFAFVRLVRFTRRAVSERIAWAPLRPAAGGVVTLGLVALFGYAYLGLSLPLLDAALAGDGVPARTFALKALFTIVSVGFGFIGGEVTPLFVTGATLGSALASPLGADRATFAAIGLATVFAAAARAPLALTVLAIELLGWRFAGPALVSCCVATLVSSRTGLYHSHHSPQRSTNDGK